MKTAFQILIGALAALGLLTVVGVLLVGCESQATATAQVEESFQHAKKVAETPSGKIYEFETPRGHCYVYERGGGAGSISCFR